jgi:hypothetical protein
MIRAKSSLSKIKIYENLMGMDSLSIAHKDENE